MDLLRQLFGPSKREIWSQLAREINANYVESTFWKGDKVEASHGQWTVTLDTYTVSNGKSASHYTRVRAPFVNRDGFRFSISRSTFFSEIGKWFGMQDIEVGHADIDPDFVIRGDDEHKLRALLANPRIRQLIAVQPRICFSVRDDEGWFGAAFPEGVDELHFVAGGVIKDIERLKALFELFAETLDHLCHIGSAYEQDPNFKL